MKRKSYKRTKVRTRPTRVKRQRHTLRTVVPPLVPDAEAFLRPEPGVVPPAEDPDVLFDQEQERLSKLSDREILQEQGIVVTAPESDISADRGHDIDLDEPPEPFLGGSGRFYKVPGQ